jgi:hypothetical protein
MDAGPAHSSSVALLAVTVLFLSGCIKSAHPEPTGEWSSVAAGTQDAVSWKLFATDPAGGGQCLAVEVGGLLLNETAPTGTISVRSPFVSSRRVS